MSKAANQVLPECGTFSTTSRVVLGVTKYVSFFDGCWICWIAARAGPPLPNLGKFMVLMIDFLAIAAVTSWRRIVRCMAVWLRARP